MKNNIPKIDKTIRSKIGVSWFFRKDGLGIFGVEPFLPVRRNFSSSLLKGKSSYLILPPYKFWNRFIQDCLCPTKYNHRNSEGTSGPPFSFGTPIKFIEKLRKHHTQTLRSSVSSLKNNGHSINEHAVRGKIPNFLGFFPLLDTNFPFWVRILSV